MTARRRISPAQTRRGQPPLARLGRQPDANLSSTAAKRRPFCRLRATQLEYRPRGRPLLDSPGRPIPTEQIQICASQVLTGIDDNIGAERRECARAAVGKPITLRYPSQCQRAASATLVSVLEVVPDRRVKSARVIARVASLVGGQMSVRERRLDCASADSCQFCLLLMANAAMASNLTVWPVPDHLQLKPSLASPASAPVLPTAPPATPPSPATGTTS